MQEGKVFMRIGDRDVEVSVHRDNLSMKEVQSKIRDMWVPESKDVRLEGSLTVSPECREKLRIWIEILRAISESNSQTEENTSSLNG